MNTQEFITAAIEYGFEQVQVTIKDHRNRQLEVLNDRVLSNQFDEEIEYSVKVEKNGKTFKTTSDYLDPILLDDLQEQFDILDSKNHDRYLEGVQLLDAMEEVNLDLSACLQELLDFDQMRREQYPLVSSLETTVIASNTKTTIVNQLGAHFEKMETNFYFYSEALAEEGEEAVTIDRKQIASSFDALQYAELIPEIMKQATFRVHKQPIESGSYRVLFLNRSLSSIIQKFIPAFSGKLVAQKLSFLQDREGKKIFSSKFTLREEPSNENLPGKNLFDDEGTPTYSKDLISEGVLKTYLYDLKMATEFDHAPTGNAYGTVTTRNLYVVPGEKSFSELMLELGDGLVIDDFIGSAADCIDSLTGDVSLQVFGYRVENGKSVSGFVPCILTTNLLDLFSNIEQVGSDLLFTSVACGAPSILVHGMSIASDSSEEK